MMSLSHVRFINCGQAKVHLKLGTQIEIQNLGADEISAYMRRDAGLLEARLVINDQVAFELSMLPNEDYTVVLQGQDVAPILYMDDHSPPKAGTAHLRILDPYGKMNYALIGSGMIKTPNVYFQVGLGHMPLTLNICGNLDIEDRLYLCSGQILTVLLGSEDHALFSYEGVHDTFMQELDLQRLMGTWYQIGGCGARLWYTWLEGGIKIHSACPRDGCSLPHLTGHATPGYTLEWNMPEENPAAWMLACGQSHLIHYADYQRVMLVGSSDRSGICLLSRTPTLNPTLESEMWTLADELGYGKHSVGYRGGDGL